MLSLCNGDAKADKQRQHLCASVHFKPVPVSILHTKLGCAKGAKPIIKHCYHANLIDCPSESFSFFFHTCRIHIHIHEWFFYPLSFISAILVRLFTKKGTVFVLVQFGVVWISTSITGCSNIHANRVKSDFSLKITHSHILSGPQYGVLTVGTLKEEKKVPSHGHGLMFGHGLILTGVSDRLNKAIFCP